MREFILKFKRINCLLGQIIKAKQFIKSYIEFILN